MAQSTDLSESKQLATNSNDLITNQLSTQYEKLKNCYKQGIVVEDDKLSVKEYENKQSFSDNCVDKIVLPINPSCDELDNQSSKSSSSNHEFVNDLDNQQQHIEPNNCDTDLDTLTSEKTLENNSHRSSNSSNSGSFTLWCKTSIEQPQNKSSLQMVLYDGNVEMGLVKSSTLQASMITINGNSCEIESTLSKANLFTAEHMLKELCQTNLNLGWPNYEFVRYHCEKQLDASMKGCNKCREHMRINPILWDESKILQLFTCNTYTQVTNGIYININVTNNDEDEDKQNTLSYFDIVKLDQTSTHVDERCRVCYLEVNGRSFHYIFVGLGLSKRYARCDASLKAYTFLVKQREKLLETPK